MRIVYGRHPVEALLDAKPGDIKRLWVAKGSELPSLDAARQAGLQVEVVNNDKLAQLAKSEHHQGLVAEAAEFSYAALEDVVTKDRPALILCLDSVQDPHNLGALARSAECFGATGLVIPQDRAATVTGAAAKSSAGAVERIPIAMVVNLARALDSLKEQGVWSTGLAGEATESLDRVDLTGPTALVVGAEGTGLRPLVRKACDRLAFIPIVGRTGSLNASVAGGIALFCAASARARPKSSAKATKALD